MPETLTRCVTDPEWSSLTTVISPERGNDNKYLSFLFNKSNEYEFKHGKMYFLQKCPEAKTGKIGGHKYTKYIYIYSC